jgi:hypothetical protein
MRRHPSLIPLTHDHHHALAQARKLQLAAGRDASDRREAAREIVGFFGADTLRHFREEEEIVFPLLLETSGEPPPELVRALVEHVRLHARVTGLKREIATDSVAETSLLEIAELLQGHVRFEEKQLFPLMEKLIAAEALDDVSLTR